MINVNVHPNIRTPHTNMPQHTASSRIIPRPCGLSYARDPVRPTQTVVVFFHSSSLSSNKLENINDN